MLSVPNRCVFENAESLRFSAAEKRVFSKGVLAEIAAMLFFHCLVVRRNSMRVQQRDAWFKTLAGVTMGHNARKSQIAELERGECSAEGGLQCTLPCTSGVRTSVVAKLPTFSDVFCTPCFTVFDVQDVRDMPEELPQVARGEEREREKTKVMQYPFSKNPLLHNCC